MEFYKKTILILSILFISHYSLAQSSGRKLISDVYQNYLTHHNISYKVRYSLKSVSNKDTSSIKASVFIDRARKDSVFGGQFLIQYRPKREIDSIQKIVKYYNFKDIFLIFAGSAQTVYKYNNPAKEKWAITGNWSAGVLKTFFLHPEKLRAIYENKENKITHTDSNDQTVVHIQYPSGARRVLHIDKKIIKKMSLIIKDSLGIQFEQWCFSNINLNSHNSKAFETRTENYLKTYKITEYQPPSKEYYALLKNGTKAPQLKGFFYTNYSKKVQIDFDKLTIIDFWYTTCGPCIKAIPELNKLKKKYGDKIQIIGVNDKESKPTKKGTIKDFLERIPISYQIFLVKDIPEAYNVKVYPTFYLIGKDGKIKYSKIGYYKNTYKVLDKKINDLLAE